VLHVKRLDQVINWSLALATASSFFIVPGLKIQLFYLLFAFAFLAFLAKLRQVPQYRAALVRCVRTFGLPLLAFILFVGLNVLLYAVSHAGSFDVSFLPDYIRTVIMIVFFIVVAVQGTELWEHLTWLKRSFLIPLILSPLLLVSDVAAVASRSPLLIFDGYKLQGFQGNNPTALAAWLVISFALCAVPVFNRARSGRSRIVYGVLAVLCMALIWWTNSRGALLSVGATLAVAVVFSYLHQRAKITASVSIALLILLVSFIILPRQAKTTVLIRFYPASVGSASVQNFQLPVKDFIKTAITMKPSFTAGQTRGEQWAPCPRFIALHPLGYFGSGVGMADPASCGFHNSFFVAAAWGGWVAAFVYAWFIWHVLAAGYRSARGAGYSEDPLWLTLAFFGIVILAMLNGFIQLKMFWILAGMIIAWRGSPPHDQSRSARKTT
jgi:hypothetical protein